MCVWVPVGQANAGNFFPRNSPDGPRPDGADISDLLIQQCDGELTYNVQWPGEGAPPVAQGAPPAVQPVVISPMDVVRQALAQLVLPRPQPQTDAGIATQLETRLSVGDNQLIEPEVEGPIEAEVTAIPVDQSWVIHGVPGGAPPVTCEPDRRPPEQQCTWTPNHSSASVDPAVAEERDGEPCFPATVTVTWEVSWVVTVAGQVVDADVEPPQTMDNDDVCLVVGEIQALNG